MIALVVLVAMAVWMLLGYLIFSKAIHPLIRHWKGREAVAVLLCPIWLTAPFLDEIIGAQDFKRLCREMPEIKFYGPVPVGPGAFFDERGNPIRLPEIRRKLTSEEIAMRGELIERQSRAWDDIIDSPQSQWRLLQKWPIPIGESRRVYTHVATGKPVLEAYSRYSSGGFIKRALGWGSHAPYQCPRKGYFPKDEEWMVFSPEVDSVR
ncbi:hypothetical protein [Uliginosibacterium sp. H1]|uniref:hypothetical protein n=1 Tax=Uliginosibacterium sp. H1 TaxID=3114757 RepID=UPI002E193ACE|nr:hypothetical protein [Uliginosibacterium sp. H1]